MNQTLLVCDNQPLPFAYRWLVEQGLTHFGPWWLITEQADSDAFRQELLREVAPPNPSAIRDFQPFARQYGCDDFAGFVLRGSHVSKEVLHVHLTFAGRPEMPGFPGMTLYEDVWAWLADCVVADMRLVAERLEEHQGRQTGQ